MNGRHCEQSEAIFHCLIRQHRHQISYEAIDGILLFHSFKNNQLKRPSPIPQASIAIA